MTYLIDISAMVDLIVLGFLACVAISVVLFRAFG